MDENNGARQRLEDEIASWDAFRRGLSPGKQEHFDELAGISREVVEKAGFPDRPLASDAMFITIMVGLFAKIRRLEEEIEAVKKNKDA